MRTKLLFPVGTSESCRFAGSFLSEKGFLLTDHPSPEVTHLLLDIPGFQGNDRELQELLRMLPKNTTVVGGILDQDYLADHRRAELLKDPLFLAKNAAITAECALLAAGPYLTSTFSDTPVLILGWGRIGKVLAKLLTGLGASVTVAARKEQDRAALEALRYRSVDFSQLEKEAVRHRLLFNTVPQGIRLAGTFPDCVILDLASAPGLACSGSVTARGLPGKYAPETTGKLIAETVLRMDKEECV